MKTFGTAAILSGGRSTRMGFDKQLLTINEKYIFERNIERLRGEFDDIIVVTNTPELYDASGIRTAGDIYPGLGPLAGLHTALSLSRSRYVYLVACDMPVINMEFAAFLKEQVRRFGTDVCASNADGHFESFNAFYSVDILSYLDETLHFSYFNNIHTPGIYGFITRNDISVTIIDEQTVRIIDPNLDLFINLNTPEEYNEYKKKTSK